MNTANAHNTHLHQFALLATGGLLLALAGCSAGAVSGPRSSCKPKMSTSGRGPAAKHAHERRMRPES
ncbi:hypothetical protein Hneap_0377 [Halothiobacillus neapolitanus c2]|uniref:Lipoprotein n=1 Tax=Halothiobacillus neapolitanus (strain ATCC 23641 / DSM 15147 / CIP 104769 / NCIMB 8539 / c2) TaxID=555778 RepID=D0KXR2_HALNC|nr:hypothetical protein Hneap_0377 [Halothiobacillus neapolitanus c2]TDN59341.1 hypothetical protein C8D83_1066 [Halothiobacillus neapolitanus]